LRFIPGMGRESKKTKLRSQLYSNFSPTIPTRRLYPLDLPVLLLMEQTSELRFGLNATVAKVRATDGTVLGTFAVGSGPDGLAFDGENIWVANVDSNTVTKLRARDGARLDDFMLLNAAGVWERCSLDQKQRLQQVLFPHGIEYSDRYLSNSGN